MRRCPSRACRPRVEQWLMCIALLRSELQSSLGVNSHIDTTQSRQPTHRHVAQQRCSFDASSALKSCVASSAFAVCCVFDRSSLASSPQAIERHDLQQLQNIHRMMPQALRLGLGIELVYLAHHCSIICSTVQNQSASQHCRCEQQSIPLAAALNLSPQLAANNQSQTLSASTLPLISVLMTYSKRISYSAAS